MSALLYTFFGVGVLTMFAVFLFIRYGDIRDDDRCDITQADERPDIFGAPEGDMSRRF